MRRPIHLAVALSAAMLLGAVLAVPANAQAPRSQAPLKYVRTYQLFPGIPGLFDHLNVDAKGHRLFIAAEQYKAVLVIDTRTGKVIHQIRGIEKPHSIFYRPKRNLLYITDGLAGAVKVYNATTYKLEHVIPLLKDSDPMLYDPATHYLYVVNGGGDVNEPYSMISVINSNTFKKIADIKVQGKTLESMAIDPNRPYLYVNDRVLNKVVVINRYTRRIVANWPISGATTNVTMKLDVLHHRLFVGCESGRMVVLDTNTGKQVASFPIPKVNDDTSFNPATDRIYASGDGYVSVYQEVTPNQYRLLGNVPTGHMGKNSVLVPQTNRLYVAVPQDGNKVAHIMVFKTEGLKQTADAAAAARHWPVSAPNAEQLVMNTLGRYPVLDKLGLQAIPPGGKRSLLIANGNMGKIGKASTPGDLAAVRSGAPYCQPVPDRAIYNMKLAMIDASGRKIGILVMEIPFSGVPDSAGAVKLAESVRKEMSAQIPNLQWLFKG